ncbi:biogenesis of lysosome-related organelles complex 1 subunit 5 isoform X3 [Stegostoma tigrinum]|uniref:biogenesis of lysosome-related organelles complex 1 subunit 5 isoform X3 n=1 Tax=Stegostoma tigrinum TaxID=3053191 RepID=UPI00202B4638|nr:biogenesis of lysosome-related organelles complex 1 subunit 5 isoform X3 [Stegostoma tigrinum]
MERARRDLSEIHSRLFDHRPIIQADIRYFIKEFEEKRGFREQRGLAGVNNLIIELNDRVLPQTCESMNSNLPSVLAKYLTPIIILSAHCSQFGISFQWKRQSKLPTGSSRGSRKQIRKIGCKPSEKGARLNGKPL